MTTAVVENIPAIKIPGPRIVEAKQRTILPLADFRCKRPTTVSKSMDGSGVVNCEAEAFVKATFPMDLERFYCAHHAKEEWDILLAHAVEILDERAFINKQASASS